MKILTILGARPQFIKATAVSRVLCSLPAVQEILVHTGQHYDEKMSDIFFDELELTAPHHNLNIRSGSHATQTGRMLEQIEHVLIKEKPDWVLVYGDTNSTLAGTLATVKLGIPLAHIEAGLRSFNPKMPEEINRILTDRVADLLFAPTIEAQRNLLNEGVPKEKTFIVGDVMYDAALYYAKKSESHSDIIKKLNLTPKNYILATIHRAENTDSMEKLLNIFEGLSLVAQEVAVVVPLHPRTHQVLKNEISFQRLKKKIYFIEPVGYLDMIMLEKNSLLIATDSGGVQKEAFFYQVPCITLRTETEWNELVKMGWNCVVPPESPQKIKEAITSNLGKKGKDGYPYGTGDASKKIVEKLLQTTL